jgi:glycosyltransferase involved in cell wall biosynthesis
MEPLRVAFAQMGADWQGGQTVVINAIRALQQVHPDVVETFVLGDASRETEAYRQATCANGIVNYTPPARSSVSRMAGAALIRLRSHNLTLERALQRDGVHVLVGESVVWQLGKVASVGWLWDFQHLHLPDLFDPREVERRERKFKLTLRLADRILATSSVERDAHAFAPTLASKIRVIEPLTLIDPATYERDPSTVIDKYRLPARFFYLPGQFWLHKNHLRLFEALNLLADRGVKPHLVLTGSPLEYRDPDYFPWLMQFVEDCELTEQVHYLGTVSRTDVFDLMRQSVCVVNPSRFEGWGYAVDEAASVGKRILASDIAAHRDQAAPACEYFDANDAEELAEKLMHVWRSAAPGPDDQLEQKARARVPQRLESFGTSLYAVLCEAVRERKSGRQLVTRERAS